MSFEFQGGLLALELLQSSGAPKEQAESVCEAIIRHQDLGESGSITTVGQLIQLATVFGRF
jgi:cyanamide hydratase